VSGGTAGGSRSERERASGSPPRSDSYRRAGVDLEAGAEAVELIRRLTAGGGSNVEEGVGGFAGLYDIGDGRHLVAGTDGVGTKIEIARMTGRLDTVGIDLVAMCADDIVCTGGEPLFFLDYLAIGRVVPERIAAIVAGVAEGCRRARCALLGGETAEHPGVMDPDRFDLAGFCVGVVEESQRIGPRLVGEGDVLIGLPSSGLHSNGFSLVRSALLDGAGYSLDDELPRLGRALADELLEASAIYAPLVVELARGGLLHAAAHVTGGGIPENVPRVLPPGLGAEVDESAWAVPPVFDLIREASGASADDMRATFNMGIGMVLVVEEGRVDEVRSRSLGSSVIGRVVAGGGVRYVREHAAEG
jgi:phosphoribosylformylglycinamidine cyclo-ligase